MRLALLFLIVCFITSTYQQYPGDYWPVRSYPRKQLMDSYNSHYFDDDVTEYDDDTPSFRKLQQGNLMRAKDSAHGKWLLPNLLPNLFTVNVASQQLSISTSTVTTLSTFTTTLTVVSVQSCIASGQFEVVSGTTKTSVCARRKRSTDYSPLLEQVPTGINPSSVISMTATEAPEPSSSHQMAIESSKTLSPDQSTELAHIRKNRAFVLTTTSTLVVTSFSLQTTPLKKAFTLVGAASLQCLPPGFTVC